LLSGQNVPLHGRGEHVRNWVHVEDNCRGIDLVMRHGVAGEAYNLGDGTDLTTKQMTGLLLEAVGAGWDRVDYVPDRRANDIRYAMDCTKARTDLGYRPTWDLQAGLAQTVQWYRAHRDRWDTRPLATIGAGTNEYVDVR
ncbi:MAG: GDP-mannose 4,6-dehydratase, partial [Actinomycetota bacterium]|nr:GDP-mannose 4,6-dehydratase [Actinomycetota bacterium]